MKYHSFYTKKPLAQIDGLEDIASWAGNHQEKMIVVDCRCSRCYIIWNDIGSSSNSHCVFC